MSFPAFLGYEYLGERHHHARRNYALFLLHWPCLFLSDQFAPVRIFGIRPAIVLLGALLLWLSLLLRRADEGESL